MDKHWWEYWCPDFETPRELPGWEEELRGLPPFPDPGPLTGDQLYEAVGGWGSTKAPGLDGWRPAELKDWPPQLFDLLAAFYGRVEAAGEWPSALSESLVATLPKGGTRELEDRRPIVLLSVVYRLWGALRASLFGRWLEEAGILPAPGPGRAADAQAYEAALEFELARAKGEPVAGLALPAGHGSQTVRGAAPASSQ